MKLDDFRNLPFRMQDLSSVFPGCANLAMKVKRLERDGKMKRILLGLSLSFLCCAVSAGTSWHIVVEDKMIPLAQVNALISPSYKAEFYILSSDGSQTGPYKEAGFKYTQDASVSNIADDNSPIIIMDSDLRLSHLKDGCSISLYNMKGIRVYETVADSSEVTIPLSSYERGALCTDSRCYIV